MLTMYPHESLRQVEWVSDLVLRLRESSEPRWVFTPSHLACLDSFGLRWFVARGHWPAKFGQPATLWLADPGDLAVSADGQHWRRLRPVPSALDPTAIEETGPVIEAKVELPSAPHHPDRWIALLASEPKIIAVEVTTPVRDEPLVVTASG